MTFTPNEFGRPEIPSAELELEMIPRSGAPYHPDIADFALTFDGYARYGARLAQIGTSGLDDFLAAGKLPRTLDRLRACLFFQQRFWRVQEHGPDGDAVRFMEALLTSIRAKLRAKG